MNPDEIYEKILFFIQNGKNLHLKRLSQKTFGYIISIKIQPDSIKTFSILLKILFTDRKVLFIHYFLACILPKK